MRAPLLILAGLLAISPARAETTRIPAGQPPASGKVLPLRGAGHANSCAAYGPGFVKVEATGSCVRIGGSLDVGVSTSNRR